MEHHFQRRALPPIASAVEHRREKRLFRANWLRGALQVPERYLTYLLIGSSYFQNQLAGSYLNGQYDGALGDTGRALETPSYNLEAVLQSAVNQAIQTVQGSASLTPEKIQLLRTQLDISECKGKRRAEDLPCLGAISCDLAGFLKLLAEFAGECLFDLENDPCETENLFDRKPVVGGILKAKLHRYFNQLVPSRNRKIDWNSNPKNCNGTWFPWLDVDGCERV